MSTSTASANLVNFNPNITRGVSRAVEKALADGKTALVPTSWLENLIGSGRLDTLITRRTAKRLPNPVSFTPASIAGTSGRERIYHLIGNRETIRGRKTTRRMFDYLKDHPKGVTMRMICKDLKMPVSTAGYTLRKLQKKHVLGHLRHRAS